MTAAIWSLIASLLATALASSAALYFKVRQDRLRAQLELISDQLRNFYGPMLASAEATGQAYQVFLRRYASDEKRTFWDNEVRPSAEAIGAWYQWVQTVFMPANEMMVRLISTRSDLLIVDRRHSQSSQISVMPDCLVDLCAHVLSLRAELASWTHDFESVQAPVVPYFPREELMRYLRSSFNHLKQEQAKLLRATTSTRGYSVMISRAVPDLIGRREVKSNE
jgi:hypothetical protein